MQINFDPFTSTIQQLERLQCMKWANTNLETINGHKLDDISKDVQNIMNEENNQWVPFLNKTCFYVTATLTAGIVMTLFLEIGLRLTKRNPIKFFSDFKFQLFSATCASLCGLFNMSYIRNQIDIKTNIRQKVINKWHREQAVLNKWVEDLPQNVNSLNQLHTIVKNCLKSSTEDQQDQIKEFDRLIELAITKVKANMILIKKIPKL